MRNGNSRRLMRERPFEGVLGARLYTGLDARENILFMRAVATGGTSRNLREPRSRDAAVAAVDFPITSLNWTVPPEMWNHWVWFQIRTHEADVEHDTLWRPRRVFVDATGNMHGEILGTATKVSQERRDFGPIRFSFEWFPHRDGVEPNRFRIVSTPSVPDVIFDANGRGLYTVEMTGLTDTVQYSFAIIAERTTPPLATKTVLTVVERSDATGPAIVSGVTISDT